MTLTSLLVCQDDEAARVLRRVLEELSIEVELCPDLSRAAFRLTQERYDVIILDCDSKPDVAELLKDTRASRTNDGTLAVAIVQEQETIRELFSLGVNFVLYKPVLYDRALSSLRAARAVMRKEKRRSARTPVHTHATVDYANVERERATLIDLAHNGMSVQFGKKLPPTSKVYFQFTLPEQTAPVRLSGQVVWQDWNGKAGVQFVDVPKTSRRLLDEFLTVSLANADTDEFSTVTVELELPLAPKTSTASSTAPPPGGREQVNRDHTSKKSHDRASGSQVQGSSRAGEETPPGLMQSQPHGEDNRREQARHTCRLGAEVFRTGNRVPNHCCLTDLSPGGCYLEIPLPFPKGASVEITVRTYDLKLRFSGIVQSSHPGFGMGVAFELKTHEDHQQVQKLMDFVVTTQTTN